MLYEHYLQGQKEKPHKLLRLAGGVPVGGGRPKDMNVPLPKLKGKHKTTANKINPRREEVTS